MLPLLGRFILNFSSAFFKRWVYWLALNFKVASLHSNKFNSLKILLYKLFFVFFYYYYLVLNRVAEGFVSSKTLFQVEQFILISPSSKRRKNVTAGRQSSQEYLWMWFTLQKLSLNWLIHPWKKSKHEAFLFFFFWHSEVFFILSWILMFAKTNSLGFIWKWNSPLSCATNPDM